MRGSAQEVISSRQAAPDPAPVSALETSDSLTGLKAVDRIDPCEIGHPLYSVSSERDTRGGVRATLRFVPESTDPGGPGREYRGASSLLARSAKLDAMLARGEVSLRVIPEASREPNVN